MVKDFKLFSNARAISDPQVPLSNLGLIFLLHSKYLVSFNDKGLWEFLFSSDGMYCLYSLFCSNILVGCTNEEVWNVNAGFWECMEDV